MTYIPQRPVYPRDYPDMPESSEPEEGEIEWTFSTPMNIRVGEKQTVRVTYNKKTHADRYDKVSETAEQVTIVIEPKEKS